MILYGNTKKKPLVIDNVIEVVVNPEKALISFSKAALEHFGIVDKYIAIAEDEGTVVAGIANVKMYLYVAEDGKGFKVFKNGNVNSKYCALLLKDAFNKGMDGIFKLDIQINPHIEADLPEVQFFEFTKSTEGIVSPKTQAETQTFIDNLPNTTLTPEQIEAITRASVPNDAIIIGDTVDQQESQLANMELVSEMAGLGMSIDQLERAL